MLTVAVRPAIAITLFFMPVLCNFMGFKEGIPLAYSLCQCIPLPTRGFHTKGIPLAYSPC
jgi:hypothetical protein